MTGSETNRPVEYTEVNCISQTYRDCQGGSTTLPYRYHRFGAEFIPGETAVASGWPVFVNTGIKDLSHQQRVVGVAPEGARITEQIFAGTVAKEALLFEGHNAPSGLTSVAHYEWSISEQSKTSTVKVQYADMSDVMPPIMRLFMRAREEEFEDGMSSDFSRRLVQMVRRGGQAVIGVLADLVPNGTLNVEIGAEALRWIGRMRDPETYEGRRWLLERSLFSRFPRIRDGAALGLSSMNDPHTIQYLEIAVDREEIEELRVDLEKVIVDLRG